MPFLTDLYTFINDTLTVDGGSGDFVDFGCDGNIILSGNIIVLWRVGLDTSQCEEQQLAISSEAISLKHLGYIKTTRIHLIQLQI